MIDFIVEATFFHNGRAKFFKIPRELTVFHPVFHNRALTFANKANFRQKVTLFHL